MDKSNNHKRPAGVWFLTIWDALFAGLAPISLIFIVLLNINQANAEIGMTFLDALPSLVIEVLTIVFAILAWRGSNIGRIGLLIGAVLFYGGIAYNNINLANSGALSGSEQPLAFARFARSVFWIIVNGYYFLFSKSARAFYSTRRP